MVAAHFRKKLIASRMPFVEVRRIERFVCGVREDEVSHLEFAHRAVVCIRQRIEFLADA